MIYKYAVPFFECWFQSNLLFEIAFIVSLSPGKLAWDCDIINLAISESRYDICRVPSPYAYRLQRWLICEIVVNISARMVITNWGCTFFSLYTSVYYKHRWAAVGICPKLSDGRKQNGAFSWLECSYIARPDLLSGSAWWCSSPFQPLGNGVKYKRIGWRTGTTSGPYVFRDAIN